MNDNNKDKIDNDKNKMRNSEKYIKENKRVRICDIADELGLSTATVSNVIHGKTKKISDETIKRVQQLLEEREYIPSMAGILLARNDSRIIGVVIHNHEKYEGHVLEDPFISSALNHLSVEIEKSGHFMMIKTTTEYREIITFSSMWNMTGMVLIGFCEQDYQKLRESMRIPFVIYDGFMENTRKKVITDSQKEPARICNIVIDNYDGGYQAGTFLTNLGHQNLLCISDNQICMDLERYEGFEAGVRENGANADFMLIPMQYEKRHLLYQTMLDKIKEYTAIFAVSDYYAIDIMQFLMENSIKVPQDISIVGFDDTPLCRQIVPSLTSIRQNCELRAIKALSILQKLKQHKETEKSIILPVELIERESTAKCTKQAD